MKMVAEIVYHVFGVSLFRNLIGFLLFLLPDFVKLIRNLVLTGLDRWMKKLFESHWTKAISWSNIHDAWSDWRWQTQRTEKLDKLENVKHPFCHSHCIGNPISL